MFRFYKKCGLNARAGGVFTLGALLLLSCIPLKAAVVVDKTTQVNYEIVEGTQTVVVSDQQSLNQYTGILTIPASVTDENTESVTCGQTFTVVGIKPGAFQYTPITGVVIEASLTAIPERAFYYCSGITSVQLPECVETIGNSAFSNCSSLTSVSTLPSLRSIGQYAFNGCRTLPGFETGNALELIDNNAFSNCSELREFKLAVTAPLTRIGQSAFSYCTQLAFPLLPESTEIIDYYAFQYCKNLGKVSIPGKARIIQSAFQYSCISELVFPETEGWGFGTPEGAEQFVGYGTQIFWGASLPEEIFIPASCKELPDMIFDSTSGVRKITVADNPSLKVGIRFADSSRDLEEILFQGKAKSIGSSLAAGSSVRKVTLPEAPIADGAFYGCPNIKEVIFPENKVPLGIRMFECATGLESITLPAWLDTIPEKMFYEAENLREVVIPVGVKHIGMEAFGYSGINPSRADFLPEGLESIESYAFNTCRQLGDVKLPSTLREIGFLAFYQCDKLDLKEFDKCTSLKSIDKGAFARCTSIKEVVCPPNLETLGEATDKVWHVKPSSTGYFEQYGPFQSCSGIEKVVLNPGLKVGVGAFAATGVTDFHIPQGVDVRLANAMFQECQNLTHIEIPAYIDSIPLAMFMSCRNVDTIFIAEGVKLIGDNAFNDYRNSVPLGISLPSTLRKIGAGAFLSTLLHLPQLPPDLYEIGEFGLGRALDCDTLVIPASLKILGNNALFDNQKLSHVVFPEYPEINPADIDSPEKMPVKFGCDVLANNPIESMQLPAWMVYVPDGLLHQETDKYAYRSNSKYGYEILESQYVNRYNCLSQVIFPPMVKSVGANAFKNTLKLMVSDFPSTVTQYGANSFENSGSGLLQDEDGNELYLGYLVIADGCEFKDKAFSNAKLRGIRFDGCAEFGNGSLEKMSYVTEVDFPECMEIIPNGFCKEWTRLERVGYINNRVREIGDEAFMKCPALTGTLDLSKLSRLEKIGKSCFEGSKYTAISWPESKTDTLSLGSRAFCELPLTALVIPSNVYSIGSECFFKNYSLQSLEFETRDPSKWLEVGNFAFRYSRMPLLHLPDCNIKLGTYAFADTYIQSLDWPADTRTVSLNSYAFYNCYKLTGLRVHPSVTSVPNYCFQKCSGATSIEIPSATIIGERAFSDCTNAAKIEFGAVPTNIGTYAFYNCKAMTELVLPGAPEVVGAYAFASCMQLKDIKVTDTELHKIKQIGVLAFSECALLESFPDIFHPTCAIPNGLFSNCGNLVSLRLPAYNTNSTSYKTSYRFLNCKKLQSIDYITDRGIYINLDDFRNSGTAYIYPPMKGLTYALGNPSSVRVSKYNTTANAVRRWYHPIKIMVSRGQKYKFIEGGFNVLNESGNQFFDITEIKDPQLTLHGEIFSNFSLGEEVNHYTGVLRWQMELSDLDSENATEYELWRDGNKVAAFTFDKPEYLPAGVTDGSVSTTKPVWAVAYHAYDAQGTDITDQLVYGDFYFEFEPGKYTNTIQTAQSKVYFDGSSTARIGQVEKLGRESWFLYKDHFDSQHLDSYGVPVSHTYVLKMKNYGYTEPENNEGLVAGADGYCWHYESKRTGIPGQDWMESEPCVLHTSIAHPSIGIDGLYTRAQVEADTDRSLEPTTVPENATYAISYNVHGDAVNHQLYSTTGSSTGTYIVKSVQAHVLNSRSDLASDGTKWGDPMEINGNPTGIIAGPPVSIVPNKTAFQTVTDAGHRGTFGSPKVSLLGAPSLEISAALKGGSLHTHDAWSVSVPVSVDFTPLLQQFGYGDGAPELEEGKYFIGLWRTVKPYSQAREAAEADAESADEQLVWHSDGLCNDEDCERCAGQGFDHDSMTYTDYAPIPKSSLTSIGYTARLYVQKPDDPAMYALAEASSPEVVHRVWTGVDDILDSLPESEFNRILAEGKLFNAQGLAIARPEPGTVFIALHDGKAYRLRMPLR